MDVESATNAIVAWGMSRHAALSSAAYIGRDRYKQTNTASHDVPPILYITGPTGTGKSYAAKKAGQILRESLDVECHTIDGRKNSLLLAVDYDSLAPMTTFESTLRKVHDGSENGRPQFLLVDNVDELTNPKRGLTIKEAEELFSAFAAAWTYKFVYVIIIAESVNYYTFPTSPLPWGQVIVGNKLRLRHPTESDLLTRLKDSINTGLKIENPNRKVNDFDLMKSIKTSGAKNFHEIQKLGWTMVTGTPWVSPVIQKARSRWEIQTPPYNLVINSILEPLGLDGKCLRGRFALVDRYNLLSRIIAQGDFKGGGSAILVGTGGSHFALCLAQELGRPYCVVTPAEIVEAAVGGALRALGELARLLEEASEMVLIMEHLDVLLAGAPPYMEKGLKDLLKKCANGGVVLATLKDRLDNGHIMCLFTRTISLTPLNFDSLGDLLKMYLRGRFCGDVDEAIDSILSQRKFGSYAVGDAAGDAAGRDAAAVGVAAGRDAAAVGVAAGRDAAAVGVAAGRDAAAVVNPGEIIIEIRQLAMNAIREGRDSLDRRDLEKLCSKL